MQTISLVKKILADGSPCRKCKDVTDRLERDNYIADIDRIVIADERVEDNEGMVLANRARKINPQAFRAIVAPNRHR